MFLSNQFARGRGARARRTITDGTCAICEAFEGRRLLTVYTWSVPSTNPWTGVAPTSVTLKQGFSQGQVKAFLNGNTTSNADHVFTNTTGEDSVSCSTSNFLFVDQVPAAAKPTSDGPNDGIEVHGGSGGTLEIDTGSNDRLMRSRKAQPRVVRCA